MNDAEDHRRLLQKIEAGIGQSNQPNDADDRGEFLKTLLLIRRIYSLFHVGTGSQNLDDDIEARTRFLRPVLFLSPFSLLYDCPIHLPDHPLFRIIPSAGPKWRCCGSHSQISRSCTMTWGPSVPRPSHSTRISGLWLAKFIITPGQ